MKETIRIYLRNKLNLTYIRGGECKGTYYVHVKRDNIMNNNYTNKRYNVHCTYIKIVKYKMNYMNIEQL